MRFIYNDPLLKETRHTLRNTEGVSKKKTVTPLFPLM